MAHTSFERGISMCSSFKAFKDKIAYFLAILVTLGAWALLLLSIIWVLGMIGWYLLAKLWLKELFISNAIFSTVAVVFIAVFWAALLYGGALLWSNYHYHRYYKNNNRQLSPLIMRAQPLLWQDKILDVNKSYKEMAAVAEYSGNNEHYTDETHYNESFSYDIALHEDLRDHMGRIVLAAGDAITLNVIENIIEHGLYGEFIDKLSKQTLLGEEKSGVT